MTYNTDFEVKLGMENFHVDHLWRYVMKLRNAIQTEIYGFALADKYSLESRRTL